MWRHSLAGLAGLLLANSAVTAGITAEVPPNTMLDAEQSIPWRGVGRVNVTDGWNCGACTGALIAPDIVLTAAHCLIHPRTKKPVAPKSVHFVAGWHKGTKTGHGRAAAVVLHPDWPGIAARGTAAIGTDVALIRLSQPLGPSEAAPFASARPPLPGDPVTLISYRRDRPHALTRQDDCRYRAVLDHVLALDCAVTFGASGAPIFVRSAGEMQIVAVLSAMAGGGRQRAYAARADTALEILLDLLP